MRDWLTSQNVDAPATDSRWPTKAEVTAVLIRLRGFRIRFTDNGPGARPNDSLDDGAEITFEKGDPALIIALLRDVARQTGPLVLMSDAGDDPLVVDSTVPYRKLVDRFCDVDADSPSWPWLLDIAGGTSDTKP